jgi:hypothetical protein
VTEIGSRDLSDASIVALGRRFAEGFNRRDPELLIVVCDSAVEWHPVVVVGEGRTYRGHDGLRQWIVDLDAAGSRHLGRDVRVRRLDATCFAVFSRLYVGEVFAAPAAMVAQVGQSGKIRHAHAYRADEPTLAQLGVLDR